MCSSFRVGFKFTIDGESIKPRLFPHMEKADTFEALTHDEQFHLMQNNLEEPDSRIFPMPVFSRECYHPQNTKILLRLK